MNTRERVRQCQAEGLSIRKTAKRLGIPVSTVNSNWQRGAKARVKTDYSKDTGIAEVITTVRTLEDALLKAEVDTDIWEVERWICNSWEQHSQDAGTVPLWQIKVWLKRKHVHVSAIEHVLANLDTARKPRRKATRPPSKGCLLNISIPDLHVGKRPITGEYRVEEVYNHCIETILSRTASLPITLIHLPIGSDMLNVDTSHETTTKGTPQRQSESFEDAALRAVNLLIATIERLKEIAPVKITAVRGNHDRDSTFWLANILAHRFVSDDQVEVDHPGPGKRVYLRFGSTLILTYHGDCVKPDQLESLMIRERPHDFADCSYREAHAGHLHKSQKRRMFAQDTTGTVVFRQLPSLSPTDQWHDDNGYVGSPRFAEAQVYDFDEGPILTVEARPPKSMYE
jgi:hypothetical protein